MSARFWFDQWTSDPTISADGWPDLVIKGLQGGLDGHAYHRLQQMFLNNVASTIVIPAEYALYISGTTNEVKTTLLNDAGAGLTGFRGPAQKAEPQNLGLPASYWRAIPGFFFANPQKSTLNILDLISKHLRSVETEAPLVKQFPPVPLRPPVNWQSISQTLAEFYARNDQRKLGFDPLRAAFYVHDLKTYSEDSAKKAYAAAINRIEGAIDRDFRPGAGAGAFRNLGIPDAEKGLMLGQIEALRLQVDKITDSMNFEYDRLPGKDTSKRGIIFTLTRDVKLFFVLERNDFVHTTDQSKWEFTGDKVHFSIQPGELEAAWNLLMPVLIENDRLIKEFKVTDMKMASELSASSETARRVYHGAQISVYLHIAAHQRRAETIREFAELMRNLSWRLQEETFSPGVQPESDVPITGFLSYRHEIDDLLDREKNKMAKQKSVVAKQNESDYRLRKDVYMESSDARYAAHFAAMQSLPICETLLKGF